MSAGSWIVMRLALVLALLAPATHAGAYAFLYVPSSQGVPQRWDQPSLPDGRIPWVMAAEVGGNVIGDRVALDVITASFASWEDVAPSSARFAFQGIVGSRNRNSRDRVNLITLGAQESLGTGVLAATFIASEDSGRITDADIVFGRDVAFSTSATPDPGRFDVEAIATHEIGHLLGLEHSGLARATMAPFTDRGDVHQRTPHLDDQIGAALLYPADGFLGSTGALAGRVTLAGAPVFVAHVVAARADGPIVAGTLSEPDGSYRIEGLAPGAYVVYAEPLDGPITTGNVNAFRSGFGGVPTSGYGTFFH